MYFRDCSMSNICSYTKVKPHCEYDACITKCTILAKFFSYPLNYSALYLIFYKSVPVLCKQTACLHYGLIYSISVFFFDFVKWYNGYLYNV